jgi:hypothetical protein
MFDTDDTDQAQINSAELHNCKLYGNSTDFRTSKIVVGARGLALISVLLRLAGGDGTGAHELYCYSI